MSHFQTIVTGHGKFATGFKGAIELLAGKQDTMTFVDFSESMNELDLGKKLSELVKDDSVLIFTDLAGGTPYKEAAKIAFNNPKVKVVAGCNLASLLETAFNEYETLQDYANDLVKVTCQSAEVLDLSDSDDEKEETEDDGI